MSLWSVQKIILCILLGAMWVRQVTAGVTAQAVVGWKL